MMRGADLSSADMDVRKFVIRVAAELGDALGDCLAGIYVHGSLAGGSFFRNSSDLDFLVLVSGPLTAEMKARLQRAAQALEAAKPIGGALELTALQQQHALHFEHPAVAEWQHNSSVHAIPAQLVHVKQRGVRLTGPQPEDAVGPVPWHAFIAAVMYGFERLAADVEAAPASVVLNACRTLYDVKARTISVVDKLTAAEWALAHVPERFAPLIHDALAQKRTSSPRAFAREEVEALRAFVATAAEPAFAKVRDDDDDAEDED